MPIHDERRSCPSRHSRGLRRSVARSLPMAASTALALAIGADSAVSSQVVQQEAEDCGDRAALVVTVSDEPELIRVPRATVVLRWADAVRRPVREAADSDGRFFLRVPGDARQATLWAESATHRARRRSSRSNPAWRTRSNSGSCSERREPGGSQARFEMHGPISPSPRQRSPSRVARRWSPATDGAALPSVGSPSARTNSRCGTSDTLR